MSAVAKEAPRTAASLQSEIGTLETNLAEATREHGEAKSRLPTLIASGNDAEIAECRKAVRGHDKRIQELTASLEETREALQIAQGSDRKAARAQTARRVQHSMDAAGKAVRALADAIVVFGQAIPAARKALEEVEILIRNDAGVYVDPLLLRAKITGITEMALWLHTEGAFGTLPTLDSRDQLRANGRADLKAQFAEYRAYIMGRVRSALGVQD